MHMLPPAIGLFSALLKREGHTISLFDSTHWIIPGENAFDSDKEKEKNLNVKPFDTSIFDRSLRTTDVYDDFKKHVETFSPDLIAVSATEDLFPIALRLLQTVRNTGIPTLLGGVFATFAPEFCLSFPEIDMVCIGEGEKAIVELCSRMERKKRYDDVKNLWIKKKNGTIVRNPLNEPVNIDENPFIDFSIFEESRFYRPMAGKIYRMLPVETHRGCPYSCTYCNSPSQRGLYLRETGKGFFRKKKVGNLYKELLHFKKVLKADYFYFWADTFFAYSDREISEFCEMYEEIGVPFFCQIRPEMVKKNQIDRLKKIGLNRLAFGIEHGNEKFRREVLSRKMSNTNIIKSSQILDHYDISYSVNNIIGFPYETRDLTMDTIELNRSINAADFNAYSFTPFHGTHLRKVAEDLGYIERNTIARSITKPTILKMPQFSMEAIEGIRRCFVLYIKMPKSRWKEIRKAEELTPKGNNIWRKLRDE